MNNCSLLKVFISFMFLGTIVDASSSGRRTGPSPPRNLRRIVIGPLSKRKHHVYWTASQETGGLAVNYSLKLCINDSVDADNDSCKWSSNSQCQPRNILGAIKKFSCVLEKEDFFSYTGEFCNYTICVVASNEVGTAKSCIFAPLVKSGLATPLPPTTFSVMPENTGGVRVQWGLDSLYSYYNTVVIVTYHAEHKPNKTKKVTAKTTFTKLRELEAYTKYCFYVMLQTFGRYGKHSAPSDVLGPTCVRTSAEDPIDPPMVQLAQSVRFPDDKSLRNVTVEWPPAKQSSWKGTPGQYVLYSEYHLLSHNDPFKGKRTYNVSSSSNRTVLQKLSSSDSYNVYIRSYNKQGKRSVRGNHYVIKPMQDNSLQASKQEGFTSAQIASIVVAVIVGLIAAGIVLYIFFNFKKNRRENASRPPLSDKVQLDNPADLHEYNMAEQSEHKYSTLYAYVQNDAKDEDRV